MKNICNTYLDAVRMRRTYYGISGNAPISDAAIEDIARQALLHAPSAFNSQSGRVVVLLREYHTRLWNLVLSAITAVASPENLDAAQKKIARFAAGYGTLLVCEDSGVVQELQRKYPRYSGNFPEWSMQSSGMLQIILWTLLEEAGMGASLQHYNPLVDEDVRREFGIPQQWTLVAQMPFGTITDSPATKTFLPVEERLMVLK